MTDQSAVAREIAEWAYGPTRREHDRRAYLSRKVEAALARAHQAGRHEGLEEGLGALERIEVGGSNSTFDLAQRILKEIAFDEVRALATGKDRG